MQKSRKHIAIVLLFSILVYSSAQAFIVHSCGCHDENLIEMESTSCCTTDNVVPEEEINSCCSTDFSEGIKFESTTNHSCTDCSGNCSLSQNNKIEFPLLFVSSTFTLQKNELIKITYNLTFDDFSNSKAENRTINSTQEIFPKLFGKTLLIKFHTLKIPTTS